MSQANQFRKGDTAEYFAQYLLSYLGATILTPRQEDHGFDFHCVLGDEDRYLPEMTHACCIQIKHGKPKDIKYGGQTRGKKWKKNEINWLLDQKIPYLLGFADLQSETLTLYQASSLWLLQVLVSTEQERPYRITLKPNSKGIEMPIGKVDRKVSGSDKHGDRKSWKVTLGKPLLKLSSKLLKDEGQRRVAKYRIKSYIELDNLNRTYRQMGVSWANWICEIDWDQKPFRKAWIFENQVPIADKKQLYRSIGPYLVCLIKRFESEGKPEAVDAAKDLFYAIEDELLEESPEFGQTFRIRDLIDPPRNNSSTDTLSGK
jgi:hypothetical protein